MIDMLFNAKGERQREYLVFNTQRGGGERKRESEREGVGERRD